MRRSQHRFGRVPTPRSTSVVGVRADVFSSPGDLHRVSPQPPRKMMLESQVFPSCGFAQLCYCSRARNSAAISVVLIDSVIGVESSSQEGRIVSMQLANARKFGRRGLRDLTGWTSLLSALVLHPSPPTMMQNPPTEHARGPLSLWTSVPQPLCLAVLRGR